MEGDLVFELFFIVAVLLIIFSFFILLFILLKSIKYNPFTKVYSYIFISTGSLAMAIGLVFFGIFLYYPSIYHQILTKYKLDHNSYFLYILIFYLGGLLFNFVCSFLARNLRSLLMIAIICIFTGILALLLNIKGVDIPDGETILPLIFKYFFIGGFIYFFIAGIVFLIMEKRRKKKKEIEDKIIAREKKKEKDIIFIRPKF